MLRAMVAIAFFSALGLHVEQHDRQARQRADMGDAVAHLPGADHADARDLRRLRQQRRRRQAQA